MFPFTRPHLSFLVYKSNKTKSLWPQAMLVKKRVNIIFQSLYHLSTKESWLTFVRRTFRPIWNLFPESVAISQFLVVTSLSAMARTNNGQTMAKQWPNNGQTMARPNRKTLSMFPQQLHSACHISERFHPCMFTKTRSYGPYFLPFMNSNPQKIIQNVLVLVSK